ncbi:gamma-butyrobetaine dioxygenase [Teleopsis dalmanni]|uniref:gamma-butyrobetaine dioxygenase n=1 Tax=Teleopsis dalmanni TaxID=139649 RepID=UPI000D32B6F9|nr:gamma-butyrobetaine dioxygenase [Teleopsis dalmanni]
MNMFYKKISAILFHSTKNFKTWTRHLSVAAINGNFIVVQPKQSKSNIKFPAVWLRDNCQCNECFHKHTKSRTMNWERINHNVHVERVCAVNNVVNITWNDKHESTFDLDWLLERDFSKDNRQRYIENVYKPAPRLWSKEEYVNVSKTFEYADVANENEALLSWLETLAINGFALIKNAPDNKGVARDLANRIGYIKRTTYGEEFEVKSKENARNYAYLMKPLPLHTDMPYYEYKAGINILHCYVQSVSTGGANLMTDGFYIAEKLKQNCPDYYNILKTTPVDWYDIGNDSGTDFYNIYRSPVICLDIDGQYNRINHNTPKRDSHFTIPLEQVQSWYEAFDKFLELANKEAIEFKTRCGDVFTFNNLRMLHGRTAYEDSPSNKRHLIGAYVDWDIIYSKIRILKMQKN